MKLKVVLVFFFSFFFSCLGYDVGIITIPKTGTNLVIKCLKLIIQTNPNPNKKLNWFWQHHWAKGFNDSLSLGPTKGKLEWIKENNTRLILIKRDPRDHVCALARCLYANLDSNSLLYVIDNSNLVLSYVACNHSYFLEHPNLSSCYQEYLSWQQYPFVYVTSYEKLVGPKGGGSKEAQIQEVINIASHVRNPLDYNTADQIADRLYGGTQTFQNGKIDDWKLKFNDTVKIAFEKKEDGLLKFLGY